MPKSRNARNVVPMPQKNERTAIPLEEGTGARQGEGLFCAGNCEECGDEDFWPSPRGPDGEVKLCCSGRSPERELDARVPERWCST